MVLVKENNGLEDDKNLKETIKSSTEVEEEIKQIVEVVDKQVDVPIAEEVVEQLDVPTVEEKVSVAIEPEEVKVPKPKSKVKDSSKSDKLSHKEKKKLKKEVSCNIYNT